MNFNSFSHFSSQPLQYIIQHLKTTFQSTKPHEIIEFDVLNPDIAVSYYSGEIITKDNQSYIYRSYKVWTDLAHLLYCKMLTPIIKNQTLVTIRFQKLNQDSSFHKDLVGNEKYGTKSLYAKIHKNEESSFLYYFMQSIEQVFSKANTNDTFRVLNLGVNDGSEFEALQRYIDTTDIEFDSLDMIGIDYCQSAIQMAQEKFNDYSNIKLIQHDINRLEELSLGKFDLIISIGTLQSSGLEFKPLFMDIVQKYLKKDGAMILGFPNCRWIDGEMIYGAKAKNYNFPEQSVVIKDIYFCKKYLQQKRFRAMITGKDYLFLTAVSI